MRFIKDIWFSFPLQLFFIHLKKNFILTGTWGILFGIVTGSIGKEYGIPYLFLDPEYNGKVNWLSLLMMGVALGIFTMAFQITSYSLESNRFPFLGYLRKPFGKFFLNNLLIPAGFLVFYGMNFIRFQTESESLPLVRILIEIACFLAGFMLFLAVFFYYLIGTNKDIFVLFGPKVARSAERRRLTRLSRWVQKEQVSSVKVSYYLSSTIGIKRVSLVRTNIGSVRQVFAQNHLNAIILEGLLLTGLIALGFFSDRAFIHIPAGASLLLLFTVLVMLSGWASYWFKDWMLAALIGMSVLLNSLTLIWYKGSHGALGLSYSNPSNYSNERMRTLATDSFIERDKRSTIEALNNWKKKTGEVRPKLVFICASGGGQRAAVWTLSNLHLADSLSKGELSRHTVLFTGASGGMLGAAYYRELLLRHRERPLRLINNEKRAMEKDNLNAILFNLVVNDIFFRSLTYHYKGETYYSDRGHALEEQINRNTGGTLDKPLSSYRNAELQADIPMMLLSPTIINDGKKLYVSPLGTSYMTTSMDLPVNGTSKQVQGVEFIRFFEAQKGTNLRFLSALRMNASFPYITPSVELPSKPVMEVMDAGMTDNYGIDDALKFAFVFRSWIAASTSGIVVLSIRDAPSEKTVDQKRKQTIVGKMMSTIGGFYGVWENIQNNYNRAALSYATAWTGNKLDYLELPYTPDFKGSSGTRKLARDSISLRVVRGASLSWHLTRFEKENLKQSLMRADNLKVFERLSGLIAPK